MKDTKAYTIKEFIEEHIPLMIFLALATLLGYGFTATHYSIGIDNTNMSYYLDGGGMVAQGRLALPILDKIVMRMDMVPFWSNTVGALLLYAAVVTWCYYLKCIGGNRVNQSALIVFGTLMISYPIINEIFIYLPYTFGMAYFLCAVALILMHELWKHFDIIKAVGVVFVMGFTVSLFESFASVFLLGLFMFMIVDVIFNDDEQQTIKKYFRFFVLGLGLLFIAVIAEAMLNMIVRRSLGVYLVSGSNNDIEWFQQNALNPVYTLMAGLFYRYFLASFWYYPIAALNVSGVIMAVILVVAAIKKKRPVLLLLLLGFMLSVASLALVKGHVIPYRACATFALVVAFTGLLLMLLIKKSWLNMAFSILMIILVLNQTRILNDWFVNDYNRYQKDKEIALNIAEDIEREFDCSKPVIFSGSIALAPQVRMVSMNGYPFTNWGVTQGNWRGYDYHTFLYYHGHQFKIASQEQAREAQVVAQTMVQYPKSGYIADIGEYLVVNLGENYQVIRVNKEQKVYDWFIDVLTEYSEYTREGVIERIEPAIKS